jgi:hypothetical protein
VPAGKLLKLPHPTSRGRSGWLIEEYHKVIQTGCGIEEHALRTPDRLVPLIGLISVIEIRLFELKLLRFHRFVHFFQAT